MQDAVCACCRRNSFQDFGQLAISGQGKRHHCCFGELLSEKHTGTCITDKKGNHGHLKLRQNAEVLLHIRSQDKLNDGSSCKQIGVPCLCLQAPATANLEMPQKSPCPQTLHRRRWFISCLQLPQEAHLNLTVYCNVDILIHQPQHHTLIDFLQGSQAFFQTVQHNASQRKMLEQVRGIPVPSSHHASGL